MLSRFLKKMFGFNPTVQIEEIRFAPAIVKPGKVFRRGFRVWHPYAPIPYNDGNWYYAGCAVILFRFKFIEFTARQYQYGGERDKEIAKTLGALKCQLKA